MLDQDYGGYKKTILNYCDSLTERSTQVKQGDY